MWKEFKAFAMRGNVIDLAVGVIIGAAFGKIVSSLVADIIMPLISLISGGVNLTSLKLQIGGDAKPVELAYGSFAQAIIDFFIIALAVFLFIRFVNRFRRQAPTDPKTKRCPQCAMEISKEAKRCPYCTSQL